MARVQVGQGLLRALARRGLRGRGRLGRDADRVRGELGQGRARARHLRRVRRRPGQFPAGGDAPRPARGAASVGGGPHRSPFRPRHGRTRGRARDQGGDGEVRASGYAQDVRRAGREGLRLEAGACGQGLFRRQRRLHRLPPALRQHRHLGHPLRLLLECGLHLRDLGSPRPGSTRAWCPGPTPRTPPLAARGRSTRSASCTP